MARMQSIPYNPSPPHTGYSREVNLRNIAEKVDSEFIYSGKCATVTDVKRSSTTWTFTVKVGQGDYPNL